VAEGAGATELIASRPAARIDKGPLTALQLKRETIVREHMDSENRHEVDEQFSVRPAVVDCPLRFAVGCDSS